MKKAVVLFILILFAAVCWFFPGYLGDALLAVLHAIVWVLKLLVVIVLRLITAIFSGLNCLAMGDTGEPWGNFCQYFHEELWLLIGIPVSLIALIILPHVPLSVYKNLPYKIVYAFYYIFTPHPAAKVIKRSTGEVSDHKALIKIIDAFILGDIARLPFVFRERVLRRKAEALREYTRRREAEENLANEHLDRVLRKNRRKNEETYGRR